MLQHHFINYLFILSDEINVLASSHYWSIFLIDFPFSIYLLFVCYFLFSTACVEVCLEDSLNSLKKSFSNSNSVQQ